MNKLIIILLLGVVLLLVVFLRGDKNMIGGGPSGDGFSENPPPENLIEIQQEAEFESFRKTDVAPTM